MSEDRTIHNHCCENLKSYIWLKHSYPSIYMYSNLLYWIWRCVVRKKFTYVSEECTGSIFRLEEKPRNKQKSSQVSLLISWTLEIEAVHFPDTLVSFYQTTRRNLPGDATLQSAPWDPQIRQRYITKPKEIILPLARGRESVDVRFWWQENIYTSFHMHVVTA
jgi:hypothetical protein